MAGIQLSGLASGLDTESIISPAHGRREPAADVMLQQAGRGAGAPDGAAGHPDQAHARCKIATTTLKSVTTWRDTQTVESTRRDEGHGRAPSPARRPAATSSSSPSSPRRRARPTPTRRPATARSVTVNGDAGRRSPAGATRRRRGHGDQRRRLPRREGVFAVNVNGAARHLRAHDRAPRARRIVAGLGRRRPAARRRASTQGTVDGAAFTLLVQHRHRRAARRRADAQGRDRRDRHLGHRRQPGPEPGRHRHEVKAFVSAYNDVVDAIALASPRSAVPNAARRADAAKGSLFGDSGLSGMLDSLRRTLGDGHRLAGRRRPDARRPRHLDRRARAAARSTRTASPAS